MGPGDGIQMQRLLDLPTTLETADTHSHAHTPQQQKVSDREREQENLCALCIS